MIEVPEPNERAIQSDWSVHVGGGTDSPFLRPYVYLLEFDDGTVYIGKGRKSHWLEHGEYHNYRARILYFFDTDGQALRYEQELIKYFYCRALNKNGNGCYGTNDWLVKPYKNNVESNAALLRIQAEEWGRV